MSGTVSILGLGDLGLHIASLLLNGSEIRELVLAGRRITANVSRLQNTCGATRVRFHEVDASNRSSIEQILRRERPDVLVQSASLLSPWYFTSRPSPLGDALSRAGFASQVSAQLPLVAGVMQAAREVDFRGTVVNCSYPDLTHPILARMGLAPTIGIGNVGMILFKVRLALAEQAARGRERDSNYPQVRVLAHHAHVRGAMLSQRPEQGDCHPRVFLGESCERADELVYAGPAFPSHPRLNILSAASALPLIRALLPEGGPLRTSAPGPLGLPGGFPVFIANGSVQLDLPQCLSLNQALAFHRESMRLDGVEEIADDGTVIYTAGAQSAVQQLAPELCRPLHPSDAERRFRYLSGLL